MVSITKNALSNLYRKLFPSTGIVRDDAREYVAGDDTRFINWNVTAKANAPFVDNVRTDSGDDVIFALDISKSMRFGTQRQSKISLAADILSALAQLSEMNNDKAGLVLFSNRIEKFLPPRRNTKVFQHLVRMEAESDERLKTDLSNALRFLCKVIKRRSVIILMCDTFALAANRKSALSQFHVLQSKHDVILLTIVDDNDMLRGQIGRVTVEDSESGEIFEIDTDDSAIMVNVDARYSSYRKMIFKGVENSGVKNFVVNTKSSPMKTLFTLFK
ncbi:MAG: DUF58 domain-containing protein [Puniceicoccales bacterium]|jgi:uncharacterized protein (DUF58 family)|nr:DUF58 domain-containing protein [Puniceicoccales bacterium]